jgi:surfactin synthase thioesterase subunit
MNSASARSAWFPYERAAASPRVRLFCFPAAGAGASAFAAFGAELAPEIAGCAVQLPGRETRIHEPLPQNGATLIAAIADAVASRRDAPAALFGHSFGAAVALEGAHALQRRGCAPAHVFLSGLAPFSLRPARRLHARSDEEVIAWLRTLGGETAAFEDPELRAIFLPYLRADLALLDQFRGEGGALPCPLTVFGGHDDVTTPASALMGWRAATTAECRVWLFPGGHFFLIPHRRAVAQRIAEMLLPAQPAESAANTAHLAFSP